MGRNILKLDVRGFAEMIEKLDRLGGDIKSVVNDALEQVGETIAEDTIEAMNSANLPAAGKYSEGDTVASIVKNPRVIWEGPFASIGVGFDKTKEGAGGWLITGTPRMRPNPALERIYARKKYSKWIMEGVSDVIQDAIIEKMEG